MSTFSLILTAAGSSLRFSSSLKNLETVKKEFLKLDEHTVLYHAALPFLSMPTLKRVIVTCADGYVEDAKEALEDLPEKGIPFTFIVGGRTRQESVRKALEELDKYNDSDYVAIQDGARPYVKQSLIENTLSDAIQYSGALPGLPLTDSVRRVDKGGIITECVEREGLYRVQTPQIFEFKKILEAHRRFKGLFATDDAELFSLAGYTTKITQGDEGNIKITYALDIPDAERKAREYLERKGERK
ncbi:MAG: 2-C-methyl-D-erythritol 4-phosphate cytidylyltransferase [Sphaerochaetaceae bacterium]|nr:2-C-methyl-D-erythritol 4-phosphate cytidylyltransferase [Sphaerochaetaceae bacterium]